MTTLRRSWATPARRWASGVITAIVGCAVVGVVATGAGGAASLDGPSPPAVADESVPVPPRGGDGGTTTEGPGSATAEGVASDGQLVTVTRVVDGDTIEVTDVGTVRLIGIDTPETVHPGEPVGCFGPEASARTSALVPPGTAVRLVYDIDRTDRYGRALAYVHRVDDDLFLNLALVADGFAQVSTHPPNVAHVERLVAAQRAAVEGGRGLWGASCAGEATDGRPTSTTSQPRTEGPGEVGPTGAFRSCADARAAGAAPVRRGEPGFGDHLDRDGDGVGCE